MSIQSMLTIPPTRGDKVDIVSPTAVEQARAETEIGAKMKIIPVLTFVLAAFLCEIAYAAPKLPGVVAKTSFKVGKSVYKVTDDGGVERDGNRISDANGVVTMIVVTQNGTVYGLGTDGNVYATPGGGQAWEQVTSRGVVTTFSMTNAGYIWGIGTDGKRYRATPYGFWKRL